MSLEQWKKWPETLHQEQDQIKRQQSAAKQECNPLTLDKENEQGEFLGSQKYYSTLTTCTCKDFFVRKMPCKHIYRLAHELGYFELNKTTNGDPRDVNKKVIVDKIEQLCRGAKDILSTISCLDIYHNKLFFCSKKDYSNDIFKQVFKTNWIKFNDDTPEKLNLIKTNILRLEMKDVGFKPSGTKKVDIVCNLIKQEPALAVIIADKYYLMGLTDVMREHKHLIFYHTLKSNRPENNIKASVTLTPEEIAEFSKGIETLAKKYGIIK